MKWLLLLGIVAVLLFAVFFVGYVVGTTVSPLNAGAVQAVTSAHPGVIGHA